MLEGWGLAPYLGCSTPKLAKGSLGPVLLLVPLARCILHKHLDVWSSHLHWRKSLVRPWLVWPGSKKRPEALVRQGLWWPWSMASPRLKGSVGARPHHFDCNDSHRVPNSPSRLGVLPQGSGLAKVTGCSENFIPLHCLEHHVSWSAAELWGVGGSNTVNAKGEIIGVDPVMSCGGPDLLSWWFFIEPHWDFLCGLGVMGLPRCCEASLGSLVPDWGICRSTSRGVGC